MKFILSIPIIMTLVAGYAVFASLSLTGVMIHAILAKLIWTDE